MKAINLTPENEPDIFQALRFGAVLENVVLEDDGSVDSRTGRSPKILAAPTRLNSFTRPGSRASPVIPAMWIFLTCDAFGVLPPVSVLSPAHAMYHFISGYTAKVVGTEVGVTEPQATFSPCFGSPFLVWHPSKYAERQPTLACGWSTPAGGPSGVGKRISDAIHGGAPPTARTESDAVFGFDAVVECRNVPGDILLPRTAWADPSACGATARRLAELFRHNFKSYETGVGPEIKALVHVSTECPSPADAGRPDTRAGSSVPASPAPRPRSVGASLQFGV